MPIRSAKAQWMGNLEQGKGTVKLGSGAYEGAYSFGSRFEEGKGTNPEEMIAAAHAGCYSMAFSAELSKAGHVPKSVTTTAKVELRKDDSGPRISLITLECEAIVPGIDQVQFMTIAQGAKVGCPISKALASVEIKLQAKLVN